MDTFLKRNTLTKTITLMAMMSAINVILSLLGVYVPFVSVALIIFLPLTSAIVEISCEDKYFPIYAFGTIGLSIAVSLHNIDFTIFYIVPSIVTGFLFGFLNKKRVAPVWCIFIATIAQTVLSFSFVPLIELVTSENLIDDITAAIGLTGWKEFKEYIPLLFFLVSFIQVQLSFIVCNNELKKFGVTPRHIREIDKPAQYAAFASILLSIPFVFFAVGFSYLFVAITIFFTYFTIHKTVADQNWKKVIIYGASLLLNLFVFAIFNPLMAYGQFLLIQVCPLIIGVISLLKI